MPVSRCVAESLSILALLLGVGWVVPKATGQDGALPSEFELEYAGSAMWGWMQDVVIDGDYAFCAMGNGLQVLDISNPTSPKLEKRLFLDEAALSLSLVGDRLYLGCRSGHLYVFDVSDPTSPGQLLDFDYSYGSIYDPAIWEIVPVGDTVYLACNSGLCILDLTDLSVPEIISSFAPSYSKAHALAVVGNTVYLGSYPLTVVDVSDLDNPVEIGRFDTWGRAADIEVIDDIIYVADRAPSQPSTESRFLMLEASGEGSLVEIASYTVPGYLNGFALIDSYAYCITEHSGTVVLDVADPTSPILTSCLFPPLGEAVCLDIDRDLALVGNHGPTPVTDNWQRDMCEEDSAAATHTVLDSAKAGDLAFLDISDPAAPEMIGLYPYYGLANAVILHGDYAFVCSGVGGMTIVDVSDPSTMHAVSRLEAPQGYESTVAVGDSLVVMANWLAGLQIIDISDIDCPSVIGSYPEAGLASSLALQGNFVYVADYPTGLRIFDISDPAAPDLVASLPTPGAAVDVEVSGRYAYVSDLGAGLQIVDITDPTHPRIESNIPGYTMHIFIDGHRLYTNTSKGVKIFDISSAPNLVCLGRLTQPMSAVYDLAASQGYLCLAHAQAGISVVDVSDPCNPAQVATYDSPAIAAGVAVDDDHVYVADYVSLIAMRLPDPTSVEEPPDHGLRLPGWYQLYQNYPNPFNPSTVIEYDLPRSSSTNLTIYNIIGQRVRSLVDEHQTVGRHTVSWDGRDSGGDIVASGVYFYRLTASGVSDSRKMLLVR